MGYQPPPPPQQGYPPQPGYPPQQQYAPPPYQPGVGPPPQQKSNKGCYIALGVVGVLLLIIAGTVIGVVYWVGQKVASSPEFEDLRKVAKVMKEGMAIIVEAQNAKGTKELRGAGCQQAMVLDLGRLEKLAEIFDAGAPPADPNMPKKIAICQLQSGSEGPSCDEAAKVYVEAASPSGNFALVVQKAGQDQPKCSQLYDSGGKSIKEFDSSQTRSTISSLEGAQGTQHDDDDD